jgi:beta-xylosidase
MKWINDWPVIGVDKDGDGKGEPVLVYKKPNVGKQFPKSTVQDGDEFNETKFGLQWQWQANPPNGGWAYTTPNGSLRMFSVYKPDSIERVWNYPNILGGKFPADEFMSTMKVNFKPKHEGERFGLIVFGTDYSFVSAEKSGDIVSLLYHECQKADKNGDHFGVMIKKSIGEVFYLRVKISKGAVCQFSFSDNGSNFTPIEKNFTAKPGRWVGARIGMFCTRTNITNDAGFADIDWIRFDK